MGPVLASADGHLTVLLLCVCEEMKAKPHAQGSGSLCKMSSDCSLMCFRRVGYGYVGCQIGLGQAMMRSPCAHKW